MAMTVQQMPPVAPFPLVLGVFRRLAACCCHRHRCSCGLGEGTPRAPAAPLAVAHGPLWHRRRHAPHAPRPSRTARAAEAPPPRAPAWSARSRACVIPRRTTGGQAAPRQAPRRGAWMQPCSRPLKTKRPPEHLVDVGASPLRPAPPCGLRNPHGWRPGRCAPSSACGSLACASARVVCPCARMPCSAEGTKA